MVAAEIAWQYKSSLKQIEVGSCGHALRVWKRFVQNCREQKSFQLGYHTRRFAALIANVLGMVGTIASDLQSKACAAYREVGQLPPSAG